MGMHRRPAKDFILLSPPGLRRIKEYPAMASLGHDARLHFVLACLFPCVCKFVCNTSCRAAWRLSAMCVSLSVCL